MRVQRTLLACLAVIGGASVAHAQEVTVKIGTVRSISTAAILWGVAKGYFKDYGIKVSRFRQYAVAFNNRAIDAAITIPPFTAQLLDGGHAVNFKAPDDVVKPHPLTIAVSMVNTDFANANRELVRNYRAQLLRRL